MTELLAERSDVLCSVTCSTAEYCVSLRGEFDIYDRDGVAAAFQEGEDYRHVVVDLAQTTFIDASIIGVLVAQAALRKRVSAKRIRIVNASSHIRRLFSLCRLDQLFEFDRVPAGGSLARFLSETIGRSALV